MITDVGDGSRLIIIAGLPATGKTTLARQLEAELGAVRFSADDWMGALGIDLFDEAGRATVEQLQWNLAERLLELGAVVVVEWGTWSRAERDQLRQRARQLGASVELRFLDAEPEVLWQRDQARDPGQRAFTEKTLKQWWTAIERPSREELALFDPPIS